MIKPCVYFRDARRLCIFTMTVVSLSTGYVYGTDKAASPVAVHGQTSPSRSSGTSSVNRELQKLFRESGVEMPSMKMADLPYAKTPRMDRVKKREATSPAPAMEKRAIPGNFGRFRRNKTAAQQAPPVVHGDAHALAPPKHTSQSVPQSQSRAVTSNHPTGLVRPVSQPKTPNTGHPSSPGENMIPAEGIVDLFQPGESVSKDIQKPDAIIRSVSNKGTLPPAESKSTAPARIKRLLPGIFSRFRRDKTVTQNAGSVDPRHAQSTPRNRSRTAQPVPKQQSRAIAQKQTARLVRPKSQPNTSGKTRPATTPVDRISPNGFANPFERTEPVSNDVPNSEPEHFGQISKVISKDTLTPSQSKSVTAVRKKGLLPRIFGRFRRNKTGAQKTTPIVSRQDRASGPHKRNPAIQPVPGQLSRAVTGNQPAVLVRPASQPKTPDTIRPAAPPIDKLPPDEFVNPFETADSVSQDIPNLDWDVDLDTVDETPTVPDQDAFPAEQSTSKQPATEEEQEVSSTEQHRNPFTGVRLYSEEEFDNPFQMRNETDDEELQETTNVAETEHITAEAPHLQADVAEEHPFDVWQQHALSVGESSDEQQSRREKIEARRHMTGFMGFCPVQLREAKQLTEGSVSHESRFGPNTYHFSSAIARDRFEANPTRYAPAIGGADIVSLVNSGELHAGSLEFALWYQDRLYLFCSRETMQMFWNAPASFAN
ncbi:MAG: hypothetical protein MK110_01970 [Fuerstiella sp.]|nr:hypothetical protein [Fuerstiella sp.]